MAGEIIPPKAGNGVGNPAGSVGQGNAASAPANAPAANPLPGSTPPLEKSTVIPFGGNRGGRSRKDGLVPGSPEAREADLKKDRDRKARAAAVTKATPLPAALPAKLDGAPESAPGAPQAAAAGVVGVALLDPTVWTAQEAQPLVIHGLPVMEHLRTRRRLNKLREAKMPADVIAKIRSDSTWPQTAVETLNQSLPATAAKILTACHVPKAFASELSSLPALALLIQHEMEVDARLDKFLEEHAAKKKLETPTPEESPKK